MRFYKIDQELAARKDLNGNDKLVYSVIVNAIGSNSHSWIGKRKLAKKTGLSEATILNCIGRIKTIGILNVEHGKNGEKNFYSLPESGQRIRPVKKQDRSKDYTGTGQRIRPEAVKELDRIRNNKNYKRTNIAETSFSFALKNGKDWILTQAKYQEYKSTFSDVDLDTELKKMIQWLRDNPAKRKTASGMTRFINSWLTRAKPDEAKLQQKKLDEYSQKLIDEDQTTAEEARALLRGIV
jgi:biotin operon repressor